jgi:hypothetical protein
MSQTIKIPIGQKLSPILVEIENALWEHEAYISSKPEYTIEGFRAATKIFMSVLMDKMYELNIKEGMSLEDAGNMATKAGEEIRQIIKTYTDIDTHELYKV